MAYGTAGGLTMAALLCGPLPGTGDANSLLPLIVKARKGDAEAFEGLMVATEGQVLKLAGRLLGDRELARDAAQEVFLRVFKSLRGFREHEDFRAWLYRITVNVCRDAGRRSSRPGPRVSLDGREPEDRGTPGDASLLSRECVEAVRSALAALSPRERAAIVLRDLEELTSQEVSEILGSRPGTVRAQVASARVKLRERLAPFFERGVRT
ncbi:MAG TPA: sigma-70 family RNA polymerase sigma factor [Thermoanaerobaculia bacterium]|nr:sigma-70 family RNA polymerase sigma factor [Thermoanaerobaculia bacterium]